MDPRPPTLCLLNGEQHRSLPLDDRGLAYGDGLFETIRVRDGQTPLWDYHLARLLRGAQVLGLPLAEQDIPGQFAAALALAQQRGLSDFILKLVVTRGSGGHGFFPPKNPHPQTVILLRPVSDNCTDHPLELVVCRHRLSSNKSLAGIKHLNRLEYVLAAAATELTEGQEALLLDEKEHLVETFHHNIFLVFGNCLATPSIMRCGVTGTLRQAILSEFAPALGLECAEQDLTLDHLHCADEAFICNAVRGILPVARYGSKRWSTGAISSSLQQAISEKWKGFYDR